MPSPRVAELFRAGATSLLDPSPAWLHELREATLASERMRPVALDPVLAEGTWRTTLANLLQWLSSNVRSPGQRVPPVLEADALATARDLVRRGLDVSSLEAFRTAQGVAWRRWMQVCFGLTSDPVELQELLTASSVSMSAFVDDTIDLMSRRMDAERDELLAGTHAERRATVALLLEGARVDRARAEAQLGHRLTGPQTAAVVWTGAGGSAEELEAVAEAVVRAAGADRRLTVVAGATTLWLWLPGSAPDASALAAGAAAHPGVRVAVGRTAAGLEGFRRSHLDAVQTQQLLARPGVRRQVAAFADVQLVALLSADPAGADALVADVLGPLASADPELRHVALTYVREQCNAARTAARLFSHRNTVLRRLARVDELLPRPLADDVVHVAAALELLAWRDGG